MNRSKRISAYTPSNMDPALLKRIFVQRERLLDLIVNRMTASMTSGDKHHLLLVGPRGSGKTHLVSLAVWELKQDQRLADLMRIAWLGEDDVFSSLLHFAFAVARALADEYPDEFPADYKSKIRDLPHDDAALVVLHDVIGSLKYRHLLLITENLDQTFNSLGDSGQKKLRAFLQETRRIATLSTTQQLFAGVSSRHEAFFGFFDTHHLEPLTAENAHQLIRKIAVEQQKADLLRFLDSDQARYRIRALHHLAGGNYRMYVLLAEFLTRETLDDLVEAFEALAEEMTPYFQERMRSLPDQQRQLAQALCDATGALTVKEISQETFIAEGNCSKQLANLKMKGYVRSEKRGKESYYDMAEPLMRLCLEVKNQRGRPLRLLTRFLKAWFPENQLKSWLGTRGIDSRSEQYCRAALQSDGSFEAIINSTLITEYSKQFKAGNYSAAKKLANELTVSEPTAGHLLAAHASFMQSDFQSAAESYTRVLERPDAPSEEKAEALVNRGVAYGHLGDMQASLSDFTWVLEMPDAGAEQRARALFNRGVAYGRLGDTQAALVDYNRVQAMPDAPAKQKAKALLNRGLMYGRLGDTQAAFVDYTRVMEMSDAPAEEKAEALICRGLTYGKLSDTQAALADFKCVLKMPDATSEQKVSAQVYCGVAYSHMGDTHAALINFSCVLEIPGASAEQKAKALVYRGAIFEQLADTQSALADYTRVLEMPDAPSEQKARALFNRGVTHGLLGHADAALADYTSVLQMPDAPAEDKAMALVDRGVANGQMGHTQSALSDFTWVLEMPDAPVEQKARALFNRGVTHGLLGHKQSALADYTGVLEIPGVQAELKASALVNRGVTNGELGDIQAALADYTLALEMPDAPEEQKAKALMNRGFMYSQLVDAQAELADYERILEMPGAPAELKATALVHRGQTLNQLGDTQSALADYTRVLEMPGAPAQQRAKALFNRGLTYGQLGNTQAALADYTRLLETPDAPEEQKAMAMVNRGVMYGRLGDSQAVFADFNRVLQTPDAGAKQKALALVNRGKLYQQLKNWHESIRDFEKAIDMPGASEELKTGALFSVFEPMTAVCSLAQVVEAIKRAFELGNRNSESYGGTPGDFVSMILQRGPTEWADYVSAIVPLYIQNGVADKLGQGLTQTIQRLDEGGFSKSQLNLWNGAWQNAGKDCEALEIPLACLDAAIEVLKSDPPTDRPLFRLPLEVRQLIRPLLKQTLSEK